MVTVNAIDELQNYTAVVLLSFQLQIHIAIVQIDAE